jgi:hypothetical protein
VAALAVALALAGAAPAWAADPTPKTGRTGIGVMVGEPTGLSFKQGLGGALALDAAFGWSFSDGGAFDIHMDLLWHPAEIARERGARLNFFTGAGPRVAVLRHGGDNLLLALRIPLGLSVLFDAQGLEIFVEIVPSIALYPSSDAYLGAGLGVRLYF